MKKITLLTLTFLLLASPHLGAADKPAPEKEKAPKKSEVPEKQKEIQPSDYIDYKKSIFANAAWDSFVLDGFKKMDADDQAQALESFKKSISLGCQSPLVLFSMALIYEANGSYYSAMQFYDSSLENFKKANQDHRYYKTFKENYARALYMMGQKDKAIPLLIEASKTSNEPWVFKLLGSMAMDQQDFEVACSYFERYLGLSGNEISATERVELYTQMARISHNSGKDDKATDYYNRIVSIDPTNQEAQGFLAKRKKSNNGNQFEKAFEIFNNH